MDLTRQPPRRPSNLGIGGIVGAARMTDKARAHNDETRGEFLYGENSGLDRKILALLSISAEEFAEAADEHDDQSLNKWIVERSGISQEVIHQFNQTELERLPEDGGIQAACERPHFQIRAGKNRHQDHFSVDRIGRLGEFLAEGFDEETASHSTLKRRSGNLWRRPNGG